LQHVMSPPRLLFVGIRLGVPFPRGDLSRVGHQICVGEAPTWSPHLNATLRLEERPRRRLFSIGGQHASPHGAERGPRGVQQLAPRTPPRNHRETSQAKRPGTCFRLEDVYGRGGGVGDWGSSLAFGVCGIYRYQQLPANPMQRPRVGQPNTVNRLARWSLLF
jgi:hypothetical protein